MAAERDKVGFERGEDPLAGIDIEEMANDVSPRSGSDMRAKIEKSKKVAVDLGFDRDAESNGAVSDGGGVGISAYLDRMPDNRRHTGRDTQFSLRSKREAVVKFRLIAKNNRWVLGETFERAVTLLEEKYGTVL